MEDTHDATCAPDQERALRTFDDIVGWFTHEGGVDHVPPAPAWCESSVRVRQRRSAACTLIGFSAYSSQLNPSCWLATSVRSDRHSRLCREFVDRLEIVCRETVAWLTPASVTKPRAVWNYLCIQRVPAEASVRLMVGPGGLLRQQAIDGVLSFLDALQEPDYDVVAAMLGGGSPPSFRVWHHPHVGTTRSVPAWGEEEASMTVNDGLPLDERAPDDPGHTVVELSPPAGDGVAGHITEPPTEVLPTAVMPSIEAPTEALDQAKVNAPATVAPPVPVPPVGANTDQFAQVLPEDPPAGVPAPTRSTVEGSVEGDLFDGTPDR